MSTITNNTARELAEKAAEALAEAYEIGTASSFCDEPPDFDPPEAGAVAKIILESTNLEALIKCVEVLRDVLICDVSDNDIRTRAEQSLREFDQTKGNQ